MKKNIFSLLIVCAISSMANAQDENDAIRYGMSSYLGTARGMGVGNAMGSIGGDFSSLSINPAGIGIYRKSQLTFTPEYGTSKNDGVYNGESLSNDKSKFNFGQLGMVLAHAKSGNSYKRSAWKSSAFGFGLNRIANFSNDYSYTGKNYSNSITNKWANDFNALGGMNNQSLATVNYGAYSAYQTYLIDKDFANDSTKAVSYVPATDGLQQTKRVYEKGGMTEFVISGGGNYMEKLMIGATLGITSVKYNRTFIYEENDLSGKLTNDFKYLKFQEALSTSGTGVNFKLGAIYKPTKNFRIGIALHSPTTIQLNDESKVSMESNTDSLLTRNNPSASPITQFSQDSSLIFNYTLNTPGKAIGSASFLFNKYGFITADVEFINYANMRYNYGQGYESESASMNQTIKNTFQNAVNIRVGAEVKLEAFSIRGGFASYGNPYKNSLNSNKTQISLGLGYRTKDWFFDAAYVNTNQKFSEKPYTLANVNNALVTNNKSLYVFTIGCKL